MSSEFDEYIEEIVRDKDKKASKKLFKKGLGLEDIADIYENLNEEELIEIQNEVLNPT